MHRATTKSPRSPRPSAQKENLQVHSTEVSSGYPTKGPRLAEETCRVGGHVKDIPG